MCQNVFRAATVGQGFEMDAIAASVLEEPACPAGSALSEEP